MHRAANALFGLLVLSLVPGVSVAGGESGAETALSRADLRAGCNHYQNRARFLTREGQVEFVTMIAEACAAAETSLDGDNPGERQAAERFLRRVLHLRDTIIEMNMTRVYGAQRDPRAQPLTPDGKSAAGLGTPFGRVSDTGEFLIAHRLGLFRAYDAWLDSGANFSIAFAGRGRTPR
ncbi:MAG: hypothetical protein AAGI70_07520 [Pseudomonadota bacterium]